MFSILVHLFAGIGFMTCVLGVGTLLQAIRARRAYDRQIAKRKAALASIQDKVERQSGDDGQFHFIRPFARTPEENPVYWLVEGFWRDWVAAWDDQEFDTMVIILKRADEVLFALIHDTGVAAPKGGQS